MNVRTNKLCRIALVCAVVLAVVSSVARSGHAQDQSEKQEEADEQEAEDDGQEKPSPDEMSEEERAQYDQHLSAGQSAYADKDYETAFEQLKTAYEIHPKPSILFNLGLISEKVGNLKRAKKYYKRFTEAPGVDLDDRKRASKRIKSITEILDSTESDEEAEEAAKQRSTDLTEALKAMDQGLEQPQDDEDGSSGEQTDETQQADIGQATDSGKATSGDEGQDEETDTGEEERPDISYNWPVYASFGTAVAALSGGAATLMLAKKRAQKSREADRLENEIEYNRYSNQAKTYAGSATGLFIGGAALTGLGAFFVIKQSMDKKKSLEDKSSDSEPSSEQARLSAPKLSVSVGDEYTGAVLSVDF